MRLVDVKKNPSLSPAQLKGLLDILYARYHRRLYVKKDPLIFLYNYADSYDRELVGLLASCLSYGQVEQILKSTKKVLTLLGPSPRKTLLKKPFEEIERGLAGFKHRFTKGEEVAFLLRSVKEVLLEYGSLGELFSSFYKPCHETVLEAASAFVRSLTKGRPSSLLSNPEKGSACKRLFMYLRWQVRCDRVDPGGWEQIPPRALIVPLDTHMYRLARLLGITERKTADLKTALQVTEFFRTFCPEDPVRYDFALTRPGIYERLKSGQIKRALRVFSQKGVLPW